MKIWLVTVGEPLPDVSGRPDRVLRTGLVAQELAKRHHDVLWWGSTFDHARKQQLALTDTRVTSKHGYTLQLLHGVSYARNISLRRMVNHAQVANHFARLALEETQPDVILCSLPTSELAREVTSYSERRGVPVVIDLRDMWPDIIVDLAPQWARRLARLALTPMTRDNRYACSRATSLVGITDDFVEWGARYAGRPRGDQDRAFPLAYAPTVPSAEDQARATRFWQEAAPSITASTFVACFFGMIGHHAEFDHVVRAARSLARGPRDIQIVLCGDGDQLERLKKEAFGLPNLITPGWVGQPEIWHLMQVARVGLAPYRDTFSYRASIPTKSIEYLCAGLPIVSSLPGRLEELLRREACGVTYPVGNVEALSSHLTDLFDHPDRASDMSKRARQVFESQFSAAYVYGQLIDHLERIALNNKTS